MKKELLLLLIPLTTICLSGCNNEAPEEEPITNPTEIVDIDIVGDLNKKTYEYNDAWDFSGLSVDAIQKNDERIRLNSSEYKLTTNVDSPKRLASYLTLTVKYKKKLSISTSKTFKDIFVEDETYDADKEIKNYYSDFTFDLTGSKLINELHRHSFEKHTNFILYKNVGQYISKDKYTNTDSTDLVPGSHNTEYFYSGAFSNYNVGTKEHVWACNDSSGLWFHDDSSTDIHCVDSPNYIGGGSDLYHVRPSSYNVNQARGDAPFVEKVDFPKLKPWHDINYDNTGLKFYAYKADYKSGNVKFADYVEPPNEYKGDIARTVAYLYIHYSTNANTPAAYKYMTGNLDLKKVIGYTNDDKCIEILKKWNNLDKPSDVEKHRNHVVQQIQGNRNPFVDYPDLLNKMFQ